MRVCTILFFALLNLITNAQPEKLVILYTGDLNAQLNGIAPETEYSPLSINDDKTEGGFARIASVIRDEKANANCPVLTVDIGDFMTGSLFSALEGESGFQLSLMKEMGYDAISIGNHDFDFGPQFLADAITNASDIGDVSDILLANIAFDKTSYVDNDLALLYVNDIVKSYQVYNLDGLKIGIMSVIGSNEMTSSPHMSPITGTDPLKAVEKFVDLMQEREFVDHVIVLSHAELNKDKNGQWTGDNVNIATKAEGIDLILCPNGKYSLNEPIIVNKIPIVQSRSNGKYISRIELMVKEGKLELSNYKNIPINDKILGDENITQKIEEQQHRIEKELLAKNNLIYTNPVVELSFQLYCNKNKGAAQSNLGSITADALHYYMNTVSMSKTDVAIISTDILCNNLHKGKQLPADVFRTIPKGYGEDEMPGYPIIKFYVNNQELKGIMELLYSDPANKEETSYCIGGVRVKYNNNAHSMKRVSQIDLYTKTKQYITLNLNQDQLYSIAANTETVKMLIKKSKGKIKLKPKNETGEEIKDFNAEKIDIYPLTNKIDEAREWVALMNYMASFKDIDGNGIPNVPDRYRAKISSQDSTDKN